MRYIGLSLVIAALFTMTACSGKSNSNSSSDSNSAATAAAESPGAAATTAAGDVPSYPGAATQASGSGSNMGQTASGSVMTTDNSFDKVYSWYQQHMPSGSEKSHTTAPVQMAVFMVGDPSSGQKSVTITTQAGKTQITIAAVKSQ